MNKVRAAKGMVSLLALVGLTGVAGIAWQHLTGQASCPMLGPLPACYVILVGYVLIVVSPFLGGPLALRVFLIGLAPVLGLALAGILGELTHRLRCPHTGSGIPKCYLSAALSIALAWLGYHALVRRSE